MQFGFSLASSQKDDSWLNANAKRQSSVHVKPRLRYEYDCLVPVCSFGQSKVVASSQKDEVSAKLNET
ncbi:hypothetical protein CEXT_406181 [Caerostris extrusa]|uniref:Uncharacterized protein n=1 Tax=Caerostris extrusa TaxID=172846 RepID=A0AAV4MFQ5_CAEEX|nr:hypothetical protein CEXT_406181 [Caerostris extrusa]